jgi:hypothetical protein
LALLFSEVMASMRYFPPVRLSYSRCCGGPGPASLPHRWGEDRARSCGSARAGLVGRSGTGTSDRAAHGLRVQTSRAAIGRSCRHKPADMSAGAAQPAAHGAAVATRSRSVCARLPCDGPDAPVGEWYGQPQSRPSPGALVGGPAQASPPGPPVAGRLDAVRGPVLDRRPITLDQSRLHNERFGNTA